MSKKRSLLDFDDFERKNEQSEEITTEKQNTETVQENVTVTLNTNTEQNNEIKNNNTTTESTEEKVNSNTTVESGYGEEFLKLFAEESKRKTVEETHTRQTYLIRNDLIKRLDKLARNKDRGFKTKLVNYALEKILDEIEKA